MPNENPTMYLQKGQIPQAHELIDILEAMPMSRIFDTGKIIYSQGDSPDYLYYLKKGRVKIFISSENGSEKTLSVITQGAVFGEAAFFDGRERMSSAKAVTRSELILISKNILTDIIRRRPQTALELLRLQSNTIRLLSSQVDSIAFLSAKSRLCQFLLECAAQNRNNIITATHEEIGSIIGATRVTVSKLINELAKSGAIKTGYRKIQVLNTDILKNYLR